MYATRMLALAAWLELQGHQSTIGRFESKAKIIFNGLSTAQGNELKQQWMQSDNYTIDCRVLQLRQAIHDASV